MQEVKPRAVSPPSAYGAGMSSNETTDASPGSPDGSTEVTSKQQDHTEDLADGSETGDATTDPDQSSDVTSGGSPEGG